MQKPCLLWPSFSKVLLAKCFSRLIFVGKGEEWEACPHLGREEGHPDNICGRQVLQIKLKGEEGGMRRRMGCARYPQLRKEMPWFQNQQIALSIFEEDVWQDTLEEKLAWEMPTPAH